VLINTSDCSYIHCVTDVSFMPVPRSDRHEAFATAVVQQLSRPVDFRNVESDIV